METSAVVENYDKVCIAASFDARYTTIGLYRLLGYRKAVARLLLNENDDIKQKHLTELLQYTNDTIKKLLGL